MWAIITLHTITIKTVLGLWILAVIYILNGFVTIDGERLSSAARTQLLRP